MEIFAVFRVESEAIENDWGEKRTFHAYRTRIFGLFNPHLCIKIPQQQEQTKKEKKKEIDDKENSLTKTKIPFNWNYIERILTTTPFLLVRCDLHAPNREKKTNVQLNFPIFAKMILSIRSCQCHLKCGNGLMRWRCFLLPCLRTRKNCWQTLRKWS